MGFFPTESANGKEESPKTVNEVIEHLGGLGWDKEVYLKFTSYRTVENFITGDTL